MDNTTKQQLLYAVTAINFWLQKGWTVWDFSGNEPNVIVDELNQTAINVGKLAVDFKRKEKYAEALGAYIHLINACLKKTGKIPVAYVRGLYKVLVCVNAFKMAFAIVSTILADMQQSSYVNQQEKQVFESYFNGLIYLSIQVVDAMTFQMLLLLQRIILAIHNICCFNQILKLKTSLKGLENRSDRCTVNNFNLQELSYKNGA